MKTFLLSLGMTLLLLPSFAHPGEEEKNGKVEWLTIEEAVKRNKKEPRKILIDMYTDWCGWCKRMDATTFSDPYISEYLGGSYYAVKMNAEAEEPIKFKGKEYGHVGGAGRMGYHELANELMNGRRSYPTLVFMDENLNVIQVIPGYRKPEELDLFLKYFGGNHYRTTQYETWKAGYDSPYQ